MADFNPIKLPEELLNRLVDGDKPLEFYEINWMSYIRPDPHDVTEKIAGIATVRMWAVDARQALHMLEDNPQTLEVNGDEQDLPLVAVQSVHPVKPGISEQSMLVIKSATFTPTRMTEN